MAIAGYIKRAAHVEAVQYTGSNGEEVKQLWQFFPMEISGHGYISPGDWVVREGNRLTAYTDEEFRAIFELSDIPEAYDGA